MKRKAIIVGASGLVGQALTYELVSLYDSVIVIGRSTPTYFSDNMLFYRLESFDNLLTIFDGIALDGHTDAFCCLWLDKANAVSDEMLYQVHCTYPYEFAELCHHKGVKRLFLLSKQHANRHAKNPILRAKGELEQVLCSLDFELIVSFWVDNLTPLNQKHTLKTLVKQAWHATYYALNSKDTLSPKNIGMAMAWVAYRTLNNKNYIHELSAHQASFLTPIGPKHKQSHSSHFYIISHEAICQLIRQK